MNEKLLKAMADDIADEVDPDEVVLFGSFARGDARPNSDVDLLVVVPDNEETVRERRHITGNIYRRLAHYGVPKDIILLTRSEVEYWRDVRGHIVHTGLTEGRRLYVRA